MQHACVSAAATVSIVWACQADSAPVAVPERGVIGRSLPGWPAPSPVLVLIGVALARVAAAHSEQAPNRG